MGSRSAPGAPGVVKLDETAVDQSAVPPAPARSLHWSVAFRMARSARLVATGYSRTKSVLPTHRQQKYWDHGLSSAMFRIERPILRARSSGKSGHESQVRVDLAADEQLHGAVDVVRRDPLDVLLGVEPDVRRHDRYVQLSGSRRARRGYRPVCLSGLLTVWMGSCTNSSKQPGCTPATTVIGRPSSRRRTAPGANMKPKSISPLRERLGERLDRFA